MYLLFFFKLCLEAKKVAKQFVNPNTEEPYVHTPDGDKRMNIYSSKHDSLASIKELDPNDIFVYWLHYEKAFNTKKELSGKLYQQSSCVFFYIIQFYR